MSKNQNMSWLGVFIYITSTAVFGLIFANLCLLLFASGFPLDWEESKKYIPLTLIVGALLALSIWRLSKAFKLK